MATPRGRLPLPPRGRRRSCGSPLPIAASSATPSTETRVVDVQARGHSCAASEKSADMKGPDHQKPLRPAQVIPRDNKNRPPQLSSKRPVPTLRVAPGLAAAPAAQRARDPRFDALVGGGDEVDMAMWRTKYAWLADRQREEVKQAKAALKDSAAASKKAARRAPAAARKRRLKARQLGDEEAQALRLEMQRKQGALQRYDAAASQQAAKAASRKVEAAAVGEGKAPYFKKRAVLKEERLVAQYRELQKAGRLEKFMAKKRKKVASKQHKRVPFRRESG